jgi:hypothetical protein
MAAEGRKLLERELGSTVPTELKQLGDADLADLAAAIRAAKRAQAAALAAAAERALGHIPRILRGPVRAVFR